MTSDPMGVNWHVKANLESTRNIGTLSGFRLPQSHVELNTYTYTVNPLIWIDPLGLEFQFTIGAGGSFGGSPLILPAGFAGGGLNIGFTSSGQLIIQGQFSLSVGAGFFAGVGLQGGISRTRCPTKPGISVQHTLQGDANLGAGTFVGGSIQYDLDQGGGFQTGVGKVGAGYGFQVSGGATQTVTIATPALFSSDPPCGCE